MHWFWLWLHVLPIALGSEHPTPDLAGNEVVVRDLEKLESFSFKPQPAKLSRSAAPQPGSSAVPQLDSSAVPPPDKQTQREVDETEIATDELAAADSPGNSERQAETEPTAEEIRRQQIAECLALYFTRPIDANHLRPWSLMHGLIGYGLDAEIYFEGHPINAVSYLCSNGSGEKLRLLELVNGKQLRTKIGPGVQGHPGQLLAILAQAGASIDQPILVDGRPFTVRDLLAYEQKQCRSRTELTFMLIAFSHYLDPKATWVNQQGEKWNMAKLLREELNQPIHSGACGGTHRLMGYSYAVKQMERHGYPLAGEWLQAARVIEIHQQHAFKYQNGDGGFSTEFFQGPGNDRDWSMQLYATGHILEWLAYTLDREQLQQPKITAAVDYLLSLMMEAPNRELDVGPRGHALHALRLYEQRLYGENSNCRQLVDAGHPYEPARTAQPLKHLKLKVIVEGATTGLPATAEASPAQKTQPAGKATNPQRSAGGRNMRRR